MREITSESGPEFKSTGVSYTRCEMGLVSWTNTEGEWVGGVPVNRKKSNDILWALNLPSGAVGMIPKAVVTSDDLSDSMQSDQEPWKSA